LFHQKRPKEFPNRTRPYVAGGNPSVTIAPGSSSPMVTEKGSIRQPKAEAVPE